jgi:hypothetical protein
MADRKKSRQPVGAPPGVRVGGSFAPPLDAAKLSAYEALANTADPQVRDAMLALVRMARKFNETPPSDEPGTPHPSGRGRAVPLKAAEIERIEDVVPWQEELDMFASLFDRIDARTQKALRDAAFHLLWLARELGLDREPMTADKL